ncbi:hypothetical protein XM53_13000 [Roseovarius atlanticus]|uniref:Uncharacterized protein n=1 Tax=Roseovarius atlanticus TaxID=1641875 RepID=A0A0T5NTB2_9RHOB|nr:hypothetical protein [Roseovarius atlanticus]KRS12154.1 hypothetical protein XM53_13000 [Roseovarius atlanticus]
MALSLVAFAVPAALFLGLALLPHGRRALVAGLIAAGVLVCLWLVHSLDLLGLGAHGDDRMQIRVFLMLLALSLAWFLGTSLQVLRRRFPAHWPGWSWPAVVVVTLMVISFGIWRMATL